MRTEPLFRLAAGLALCLFAHGAYAQGYPTRPIRILIPYGPGTGVDVVVRLLAEPLGKSLGQPIVSENRAGAAGTVATTHVAAQPADGYTLLSDSSSHTIAPSLMPNLPFDTARDFAGVTTLIENPLVMVAARAKGYQSVRDLIAAAKANPGKINYASAGVGSSTHISGEKLRIGAGFEALHVPYKSTTDALVEVMAGRIDYTYTALTSALANVRDGKLVALAMASRRNVLLPDVPAVEEIVPNAGYATWIGIMVLAKTPRDIVQRLNQEIVRAMHTQDMKDRLVKLGTEPWTMSAEEFDALRRRELADNARLVKAIDIRN
jgi:tripartite-type tricarboxylate transporter receptor subunit TctC